jgi:hypothetical protein
VQNDNRTIDTMNDDEIYQLALEEWMDVLSRLWKAYSKKVDEEQLEIYFNMLRGVPMGLLEKAIERVVREHTYNTVPTVAEVWQAVRKELDNPYDVDQAIRDWCDRRWYSMFVQFPAVQEVVSVETESVA